MSWRDAVVLAAKGIARRPGRTALTVAAVALAAALLTALLTIVETGRDRVLEQLSKGGPLSGITVEGSNLNADALTRIRALSGVRSAVPVGVAPELVVPPESPVWRAGPTGPRGSGVPGAAGTPFADRVIGVDLTRSELFPISLLAGRLPEATSTTEVAVTEGYLSHVGLDRSQAVRVLGTELELGSEGPGGASRWTRATIVGVVAQDAGPGDLVAPIAQVLRTSGFSGGTSSIGPSGYGFCASEGGHCSFDGTMDVAYGAAGRFVYRNDVTGGIDCNNGVFGDPNVGVVKACYVRGTSGTPGVAAGALEADASVSFAAIIVEATNLDAVTALRERIGALGYQTSASETLIQNVERYSHVIEIVLSAVGVIALFVAGIGIADALLAAVRERRREIGVLKAIGARDRDVRRLFLVEAGLVGLVGGVCGGAVGWAMARTTAEVVNRYLTHQGLSPVSMSFPVPILASTIGGSAVLALVAGALPATRAARLPAAEAIGEV